MTEDSTRRYIETLELTPAAQVLADLALGLARTYDETGHTSTAGELRKTLSELDRVVKASHVEIDPLEHLLTRDA